MIENYNVVLSIAKEYQKTGTRVIIPVSEVDSNWFTNVFKLQKEIRNKIKLSDEE